MPCSLSRAALELGLPRATLGRRLSRLEGRLGARLLRRTTRSLVLTEAGEAFYRHARLVLEAVANAEASVRRPDDAIRGDLRVTVPPIMTHEFYALLYDFVRAHPDVRLQVHFGTRHVDLRRDGYDVAVRAGSDIEPGLIGRVLARTPMYAVASPEYLAQHGTPRTAKDLRNHRCLVGFARGELLRVTGPSREAVRSTSKGSWSRTRSPCSGRQRVRGSASPWSRRCSATTCSRAGS